MNFKIYKKGSDLLNIDIDKSLKQVYTIYIPNKKRGVIMLITTIQNWGNSQGIRIPKHILEEVNLHSDEKVTISTEDEKIIIEKVKDKKRKNIKELFEHYNGKYETIDIEWGEPEGKELW